MDTVYILLDRLIKAVIYLFTGSLEQKEEKNVEGIFPSTPAPPVHVLSVPKATAASEAFTSQLILKDTHVAHGNRTCVEVRSDGIHIQENDDAEQLVPLNADVDLLQQIDEEVRYQIARKISLLVPELADSKKDELLKHVFRVLALLSEDQVPRVRQMIAEELRNSYAAPPELIRRLAWDNELKVSAPILEFSPLLGDGDLLEIIANSDIPGVIEAVSRRQEISEDVTDAIVRNVSQSRVQKEDARIITNLLANKQVKFKEETLEIIVDEAPNYEIWHASLLERPELTARTVNKIARFVSQAMIMEMEERGLLSKDLAKNLSLSIASRLHSPQIDREKEADRTAVEMFTQGALDADCLLSAIANGERDFAISIASLLAEIPKHIVRKIVESDNPKAMTALAWRIGVPMRDAIQMQLKLGKIAHTRMLYAKDGRDYPLTPEEMRAILQRYKRNG